jgi:hypothetical protein
MIEREGPNRRQEIPFCDVHELFADATVQLRLRVILAQLSCKGLASPPAICAGW